MKKGKKQTKNSSFNGTELNLRKPYSLEQASNATGVTQKALVQAVEDKQLRGRKCGRYWRFTGKSLIDYLEGKNVR